MADHTTLEAARPGAAHSGQGARRDRNRDAVVSATVDLLTEGVARPLGAHVAERAGVSVRSVFRYFADLDELVLAAIPEYIARHDDVIRFVPSARTTPLDERVAHWVRTRHRGYGVFGRVLLDLARRSDLSPGLRRFVEELRCEAISNLALQFAPELSPLDDAGRAVTLAALHSATTLEVWTTLLDLHGLDEAGTVAAMQRLVRGALGTPRGH